MAQATVAPAIVPVTAVPAAPAPAVPPARRAHRHAPGDPLEGANRTLFSIHNFLDRILFRPISRVYKAIIPKPLRTGIRHVFSNLDEPVVFVNDVLQLKPKRAVRTFARFAINSTVGIGGVLDVAKKADLSHRPNGFGDTLGRYGVGPGPYIFIPFIGPTTLRDLLGTTADDALLPVTIPEPFSRKEYTLTRGVVTGIDLRVESDADLKALYAGAADRYASLRSVYLQDRAAEIDEIRHGVATPKLDDPLLDPDTSTTPPATPPAVDFAPPAAATASPATDPAATSSTAPTSPDTSDPLSDPAKGTPPKP
ncbi:VacJ family lipoprotein [Sphingomonas sp. RT2P30]|uniref:MlaA family lipoprotein n=1 Tax=Parasphingomonas halimpatiens TaxID=3096162 RepID=UPI002FCC312A